MARAEKGEHEGALGDLKALFKQAAAGAAAPCPPDPELALAVGEAFLQRLLRDGRYDVAQKLCDLACDGEAPVTLKEHFEDRMARLDLVGKSAPPIACSDVDGKPVSLADLKGKVVLIDFWATWCPPCVASIPASNALAQKYHDQGFMILGVNVDAMHEDVKEASTVLQSVRRFLVKHRVTWLNVLNGHGKSDFAAAYSVEQIPANFLVGRDGKIVAVEQHGEMLERDVIRALRSPRPLRSVIAKEVHHGFATIEYAHWSLDVVPVLATGGPVRRNTGHSPMRVIPRSISTAMATGRLPLEDMVRSPTDMHRLMAPWDRATRGPASSTRQPRPPFPRRPPRPDRCSTSPRPHPAGSRRRGELVAGIVPSQTRRTPHHLTMPARSIGLRRYPTSRQRQSYARPPTLLSAPSFKSRRPAATPRCGR